jgi:RNA polymerase sigma-70 factor (ECF subfamily)
MHDPTDRSLVLRSRGGERRAFGELVERYQASVFNVCLRMMGERGEAENLTQDAFLRAHNRLGTFNEERPFGPWIRRVAANLCLNQLKRSRPVTTTLEDEDYRIEQGTSPQPEPALIEHERQIRIRNAILELPPHYRAVIELRHFQELSYAEISTELSIPISDIKSHLFRARKMLAKRLENHV